MVAALVALAACSPAASGPPLEARIVRERAIVACDRRSGRRVVVRRAVPGSRLTRIAVAGPRVAWVQRFGHVAWVGETAVRRDGATTVLRMRRVGRSREVLLALTTERELAWTDDGRLLVQRPGERAEMLAHDVYRRLVLEDDRTLRWREHEQTVRFADLRPWRGCPRRRRFRQVAANERVVATIAHYGVDHVVTVVRACWRATGRERTIAEGSSTLASNDTPEVTGVHGPWVVLGRRMSNRYEGCTAEEVVPVHAATGERGRVATIPRCDAALVPREDEPPVVTDRGMPAWIVRDAARSALLTRGPDGAPVELDAAAPAGLSALSTDGPLLRWLHDGRPRSADPG